MCYDNKVNKKNKFFKKIIALIIPSFLMITISVFSFFISGLYESYGDISDLKQQIQKIDMIKKENEQKIVELHQEINELRHVIYNSDNGNADTNEDSKELEKIKQRLENFEKNLNKIEKDKQQTSDYIILLENISNDLNSIKNDKSNNTNSILICIISGFCVILAYTLQPFSKKLAEKWIPDKVENKNDGESD